MVQIVAYHQWLTEELSEVYSAWAVPVYMMGTRHCAWLNGQWRGLWKWYATWLAANAGLSGQVWCGRISSIFLLALQHCSVQAVVYSEGVCNTILGWVGIVQTCYYKCHHHLHECGIIEVVPYSADVPHMHVHAADNVSHMSGEGHFCTKGHTQITYCLTRKYWCASNSQAGGQCSEFGLVMTRDYDLKLSLYIIKHQSVTNHPRTNLLDAFFQGQ